MADEPGFEVAIRTLVYTYLWPNRANQGRFAVYYRRAPDPHAQPVTASAEHVGAACLCPLAAVRRLSEPQARALVETVRASPHAPGVATGASRSARYTTSLAPGPSRWHPLPSCGASIYACASRAVG